MNNNEIVLLSLIQRSLIHNDAEITADVDWSAVLLEAQQQAVVSIAAQGLPVDMPQKAREEWRAAEYRQLAYNIRYWNAQDQLDCLLKENGIPYVILKGASAAMLYPHPLQRSMGDIDFLVPPDQFEKAQELLQANGYQPEHEPSDRHVGFKKGNISFELHRRFSYPDLDMEEDLIAGISRAEKQTVEGHVFYTLPKAENGLVLLSHLWNHLHTGVGLRQVIDWMMYALNEVDDETRNAGFSDLIEKYGLEKLAVTTAGACQRYLGMPNTHTWYADADDDLCEDLMTEVLNAGNFGRKQPSAGEEVSKVKTALSGIQRYGFIRHLQRQGEVNWTAYHSHPWLKPFAWLYQLVRYPVLWIKSPRRQKISTLVKRENEINALLKRLR